jgi:hypothetical protein
VNPDKSGWRDHGGPWRAAVTTRPYRKNDDGGGAISSFPIAEGRRNMAGTDEPEQAGYEAGTARNLNRIGTRYSPDEFASSDATGTNGNIWL